VTRNVEKVGGEGAQLALLDELKAAALQLGFEVREEKLLREVGYRVRSGGCRLRDTNLILLDRQATPAAQIDVLVEILATAPLEQVYLSPAARRGWESGPHTSTTPDAGS
jgi:hypothetical protein